jgi:hypothetical protein
MPHTSTPETPRRKRPSSLSRRGCPETSLDHRGAGEVDAVGQFALAIAAAFTGAAVYINIAEQPARLQLDNRSLLAEWKPAYKRGYVMQASLAIVGGLFGLLVYLNTLDWRWLLGAVILLANWSYTLFVIAPINRRLMDTPPEAAEAETRRMLERWGTLHAGRSALGLVATLIFLWAQR